MTWITHPDLPGQLAEVPEGAVPHYRASGWQVTAPPPKPVKLPADESPAPEKTAPAAEAEQDKTDPEPPKSRRRTPTKED